jgi:hypothetical protein
MELAVALIVLAVGLMLERGRPVRESIRSVVRRRR